MTFDMRRRGWKVGLVGATAATTALFGPAAFAAGTATPSTPGLFQPHNLAGSPGGVQAAALPANLQVVATGLNQPKKLTIGPHGNLYVALSGDGVIPASCTDGAEASCVDTSGAIDRVTPQGVVTPVLTGLPSAGSPGTGGAPNGATGPSDAFYVNGQLQVLMQDQDIDATTGLTPYGTAGALFGDLFSVPVGGTNKTVEASFGPFEAANNPDQGAAANPAEGNPPIDSDPYGLLPYKGGYVVADAAGNDLLYVNSAGQISVLAVFPPIPENVPAGVLAPGAPATTVDAQAVPTAVVLGPDGDFYVSGLGGGPYDVGDTNVYRVVPGSTVPQVVASGLTMVGDLAFDRAGRLLVLEIDQAGLEDASNPPASGALIRINADGSRTTLASTGLLYPTGLAVAPDGSIYVSNNGVIPASGGPGGLSGEIVRVVTGTAADQIGASYGGYRLVASDGGIFTYGAYGYYGSEGGKTLNAPIVGSASVPNGPGYWEVASDGGIFTFGTAGFYGSEGGVKLNSPVVGMAPTPDGRGYWEVAADGGVFSFGDATFYGSHGGSPLNAKIVGIAATPDGGGYRLFAADGGVFTYGDASFNGSHGGAPLNAPIVGGASTPDGLGYYLVASDGGVFTYGDATFYGSHGGAALNAPVVGIQPTPNNGGYYLVASDGGVFTYGNAVFSGSAGGLHLVKPVVGIG